MSTLVVLDVLCCLSCSAAKSHPYFLLSKNCRPNKSNNIVPFAIAIKQSPSDLSFQLQKNGRRHFWWQVRLSPLSSLLSQLPLAKHICVHLLTESSHPAEDHQLTLAQWLTNSVQSSDFCPFPPSAPSLFFSSFCNVCCRKLICLASLQPIWQQWPSSATIDVLLRLTKMPQRQTDSSHHQWHQLQLSDLTTTNVSSHQD